MPSTVITDASADNPYLIKVIPGVYNEGIQMKGYVDIEGSGELTTKITGSRLCGCYYCTVQGADNAELRFLTIETNGVGIYISNTLPRLTNLTVRISNGSVGSESLGIHCVSSASPVISNVTIDVSSAGFTYGITLNSSSAKIVNTSISTTGGYSKGIFSSDISEVTITGSKIISTLGDSNVGIHIYNSSRTIIKDSIVDASYGGSVEGIRIDPGSQATISDSIVSASNPTGSEASRGIVNTNAQVIITNSTVTASGRTGSYGVETGASTTTEINNSKIKGTTNSIYTTTGSFTKVGASMLDGPAGGGGTNICAGVYDANYTFYPDTCP